MKLSEQEIENIVEKSVNKTLTRVGLFTDNPQEMQGMMYYLRTQYEGNKKMKSDIRARVATWSIPIVFLTLWEGIKHTINK